MVNFDEIRQQIELLNDDELITIYREHDEEQWRPEVFDIVGSILRERGVLPSRLSADEEDGSDETEGMDLITVANYYSSLDAETDRAALEAKGMKAWIANKKTSAVEGVPGVELRVLAEDLVAAMAILESEPAPSTDLPAEIAEPPCPRCGSRKVTEEAEVMEVPTSSGSMSAKQVWLYHCNSCGHKWTAS